MRQLIKPKHSGTVIATPRGWEVKETGELLVSLKGLDKILGTPEVEAPVVKDDIGIELPTANDKIEVTSDVPDEIDQALDSLDNDDHDDNDVEPHEVALDSVKVV